MSIPFYELSTDYAAEMATGGDIAPDEHPTPARVRSGRSLSGASSASAVARDPNGTAYQRMHTALNADHRASRRYATGPSISAISQVSSTMANAARSTGPDRMAARGPEHSVSTTYSPAHFNPASMSTRISHSDMPLSATRLDDIFSNDTSRGFAF